MDKPRIIYSAAKRAGIGDILNFAFGDAKYEFQFELDGYEPCRIICDTQEQLHVEIAERLGMRKIDE